MIFIKGVRGFEAKKAINHELEAHGYRGDERKKMKMVKCWWWWPNS